MIINPGQSGEAHRHPNADEVIYLARGKVAVRVDAETFALDATDALAIPGGLPHQIHNPGVEDAELIICYSSGDREYTPESTVKDFQGRPGNPPCQNSWKGAAVKQAHTLLA